MCLEALAEKGCSGQCGPMANKNKSLASESDGDVFVGTNLRWVTRGGSSVQFGSGTKLFEKVFSQEFRNLKLYFKNSRFSIFLKSIVPAESGEHSSIPSKVKIMSSLSLKVLNARESPQVWRKEQLP